MTGGRASELLEYLNRVEPMLDRLSHFELLGVTPETEARGIREAFYRKASMLHPDLHRLRLSPEDHERLTTVYARVAEAYLVLRDPPAREAYARSRTHQAARDEAARDEAARDEAARDEAALESALPIKARRLYQRARASMSMGDHVSAVLNLRLAVAAAPTSELLREALDRALDRALRR